MLFRTVLYLQLMFLAGPALAQNKLDVDKEFAFAAQQYTKMLATHPDTKLFPQSTNPDGDPQ